jgi:hypothetical protein
MATMKFCLRIFLKNQSAGLPENQEKHAFFKHAHFQKVSQNKDFSTKFLAICIDL